MSAEVVDAREETMEGKKMFEIKQWCAVALWSWDIDVENCAICRNHIMEPCLGCQTTTPHANQATETQECTVAWGKCNHAFHLHCISKWLEEHPRCPLDNSEWEYQSYGR